MKTKQLVERDWINLFDSTEPLEIPLAKMRKIEKTKSSDTISKKLYGLTDMEKKYNQRPEVKTRKREYNREYTQRPEVKARRRLRDRLRYLKNKKNKTR